MWMMVIMMIIMIIMMPMMIMLMMIMMLFIRHRFCHFLTRRLKGFDWHLTDNHWR